MPIVHMITIDGMIASRIDPATGPAVPMVRSDEFVAQVSTFPLAELLISAIRT